MKKKALSLMIALALLAGTYSMGSVSAFPTVIAASQTVTGTCGEHVNWSFDKSTGVLTVSGSGAMYDYEGDWDTPWDYDDFDSDAIKKIVIAKGVTSIGFYAFANCKNVKEMSIPETVTKIGAGAFSGNQALTRVTIPRSVTSIGNGTFENCSSLSNFSVDSSNSSYASVDGVLYNKNKTKLICCPAGKAGSFTVPDTVKSLSDSCFYGCEKLTSITLPKTVTAIPDYAFEGSGVKKVTLSSATVSIGDSAFAGCTNLAEITLPDSLKKIDEYAFYGCKSLKRVTIPRQVASLDCYAFCECTSLTDVTITKGVTSIDDYAFEECHSLTSVKIPSSVTFISPDAFQNCDKFTGFSVDSGNQVYASKDGVLFNKAMSKLISYPSGKTDVFYTVPSSVKTLEDGSFENLKHLKNLTIGSSVTSLEGYVFNDCETLNTITMGKSLDPDDIEAFAVLESLKAVNISKNDPKYASVDGAVFNKALTKLLFIPEGIENYEVKASVSAIGDNAYFGYGTISILNPDCEISDYAFDSGVTVLGYAGSTAEAYADENGLTFLNLKNPVITGKCGSNLTWSLNAKTGVLTISGNGAMTFPTVKNDDGDDYYQIPWWDYCNLIKSVTFNGKIKTLADSAFYECSLSEIVIPDSVTSIGDSAFEDCEKLTKVTIPDTVTSIGDFAFSGCKNLKNLTIPTSVSKIPHGMFGHLIGGKGWYDDTSCAITSIVIPDNIKSIGLLAFSDCRNLQSVVIPKSVTSIGEFAFYECAALKDIYYEGSKEDWAKIKTQYDGVELEMEQGKTKFTDDIKRVTIHYNCKQSTPLSITSQPTSVKAGAGMSVTFKVKAQGSGLSYQWQLSDNQGKTWRNSSTRTDTYSATLSDKNNGRYVRCAVTDLSGSTVYSNAASMKIAALYITQQPVNQTLKNGATATFKVKAQGDGLTYQWQLSDDQGKTWRSSKATGTTYSATVTSDNNGRYVRCIVTDKKGNSVKSNAAIMKLTTLKITTQPSNCTVKNGATATFKVVATGSGLTYQWQLSDDQGKTWRNSKATDASYTATVTDSNNGRYVRCIVTDKFGNSVKSNAAIMKLTTLKITKQPVNAKAKSGNSVTFKVTATGSGLTYLWQYSDDQGKTWRNTSCKSATYSPTVTSKNTGRYVRCVVTDKFGNSVKSNAAIMKTK